MTDVESVTGVLAATPGKLAAAADGVAPGLLTRAPADGEWSAAEVLAHVRACADVWGGCIATMLAEDEPTIRAVNPRAYIDQTDYPTLEFAPSLAAFTAQRKRLLRTLAGLTPDQWERAATITGAGKPLRRTVFYYAEWMARHERPHVKQIERAIAAARGKL